MEKDPGFQIPSGGTVLDGLYNARPVMLFSNGSNINGRWNCPPRAANLVPGGHAIRVRTQMCRSALECSTGQQELLACGGILDKVHTIPGRECNSLSDVPLSTANTTIDRPFEYQLSTDQFAAATTYTTRYTMLDPLRTSPPAIPSPPGWDTTEGSGTQPGAGHPKQTRKARKPIYGPAPDDPFSTLSESDMYEIYPPPHIVCRILPVRLLPGWL